MTDPRIEAATKAIREAMTKHGSAPDAEMLARAALAAADESDPLAKIEGVLWCVTVAGPDEVHAVQDYATGVRKARELNEWLARNNKPDENGTIIIFALVDEWPWDAESHAKDIMRQEQEEAAIAARREKKRIAELEGGGNG